MFRTSVLALVSVLAIAACTEPKRELIETAATPALETRLRISDPSARAESEISVTVELLGTSAPTVGSYTARMLYDTTALRFVGETVLSDEATRVSNPQPGVLRLAGIAPQGFKSGTLYVGRFMVLKTGAVASLRLAVDELHSVNQSDVLSALESRAP